MWLVGDVVLTGNRKEGEANSPLLTAPLTCCLLEVFTGVDGKLDINGYVTVGEQETTANDHGTIPDTRARQGRRSTSACTAKMSSVCRPGMP